MKEEVKLNIKRLKKKIKKFLKENSFDFAAYVEKQKEDKGIDLGLLLELAEENKIVYNLTPVNTLLEGMEKLRNAFFTNGFFSPSDKGETDTNRFFKGGNQLAQFIDKILDKYENHFSIYYTGNIYGSFENFKRVDRSEHGRGADEFINFLEYEGECCNIPSRNGCVLEFNNYIFKKDFSIECYEFLQ